MLRLDESGDSEACMEPFIMFSFSYYLQISNILSNFVLSLNTMFI